jgi:hypothetical protein
LNSDDKYRRTVDSAHISVFIAKALRKCEHNELIKNTISEASLSDAVTAIDNKTPLKCTWFGDGKSYRPKLVKAIQDALFDPRVTELLKHSLEKGAVHGDMGPQSAADMIVSKYVPGIDLSTTDVRKARQHLFPSKKRRKKKTLPNCE